MASIVVQIIHVEIFWETVRESLGWVHVSITEERRIFFFLLPETKLFGSFKRFLYVTEQKGNSLFLYMFLKKSSRWRKAGYRIARILLALCMLLNCFRARRCCSISENWKAHAFTQDQSFSPQKCICVYHCKDCTSLFEVTVDWSVSVPLWESFREKQASVCREWKLMGN